MGLAYYLQLVGFYGQCWEIYQSDDPMDGMGMNVFFGVTFDQWVEINK